MLSAQFGELLKLNGFDFITGVPCSYFKSLIETFSRDRFINHIPAVREDIAIGLSAGAYLSGKLPVVYMQNSGLGYCLEAIVSLHLIYAIPALILLSYRGPEDIDMEEHLVMGKHTENLLKSFNIDYSIPRERKIEPFLKKAKQNLMEKKKPYFLLFKKGVLQ